MLALKSWHSLLDLQRSPEDVLVSPCIHAFVHRASALNLPLLPAFLPLLYSLIIFLFTLLFFLHSIWSISMTESNHHLSPVLLLQFCPDYQHLSPGLSQCSPNWQPQGASENGNQMAFLYLLKPCKDFSTHSEQKPNSLLSGSVKVPPDLILFILWTCLLPFSFPTHTYPAPLVSLRSLKHFHTSTGEPFHKLFIPSIQNILPSGVNLAQFFICFPLSQAFPSSLKLYHPHSSFSFVFFRLNVL